LPTFGENLLYRIQIFLDQKKLKFSGETQFKGGKKSKRKSIKMKKSKK
jgi:hypothetical protein